jgi:hypothetical protein
VGRKFQCEARELVEGGRADEENKDNNNDEEKTKSLKI